MATNNAVNSPLSGTTGSGNFVGSTSPSITNGINDTNGNVWIGQQATASAVNHINIQNTATGVSPTISASGSDTNIQLSIIGQGTGGVIIKGTGTNDSASAGYVGEIISSDNIATGVSLSTGTIANIVSVSLTAGDWDVWGNIIFVPGGATTYTMFAAGITTSSATIPNPSIANSAISFNTTAFAAGQSQYFSLSPCRISIASTTTVYLTAQSAFAVSTLKAAAVLTARRAR